MYANAGQSIGAGRDHSHRTTPERLGGEETLQREGGLYGIGAGEEVAIPSMAFHSSSDDGSEREREHGEEEREGCDEEEWRDSSESPDHRNNDGDMVAQTLVDG